MKKKVMRFLACLLIVGFALPSVGSIVAFADNEEEISASEEVAAAAPAALTLSAPTQPAATESTGGASDPGAQVVVTGEGTPSDPKLTETTRTEVDSETGNTTVTVSEEKEWQSETVTGNEEGKSTETRDKNGNLINAEGKADGTETVITDANDEDNSETIIIDNGTGETKSGVTINSEVPDVTVDLAPGEEDEKSETAQAWFDESTLDLPDWVRTDSDGKAAWAEPSHSENDGVTDDIAVSTAADSENNTTTTTYTRTLVGKDGKTVRETVTCKRNAEGKITDYSVVTDEIESITTESTTPPENASTPNSESKTSYSFELPEKPTVPEPTYAPNGKVLNGQVVAEVCDNSGKVVGYTVVTIENGNVVDYSDPILGRYCVTETYEEVLANGLRKLTTTKTYTTSVKHSAKSGAVGTGERTVSGWMSEEVSGEIEKSGVETYQPYIKNKQDGSIDNKDQELYNRPGEDYTSSGELFIRWCGEYGIESTIRVKQGTDTTWQAHQFVLDGQDGKKYYVYCCDFDVGPKEGADYNIKRLEDADYYKNNDDNGKAQDQIRAIVLNGYWGVKNDSADSTAPTAGSLEAFRKMLVDAKVLTADEAAKITDGMALTATQAAIWYYGNSGSKVLSATDIVGERNLGGGEFGSVSKEKTELINKAYVYLINTLPGVSATQDNTLLTPADFKFAESLELTVGRKNDDGNYRTDITFTMAVTPDDESGDLVVYITDENGNIIGAYRLCGDASQDGEKVSSVIKNEDGSFTLPDVYLPAGEGVNLNLNLKGTQKLDNGVYLFNCTAGEKASQTFIGCGAVSQMIDLTVKFGFNVHDPVVLLSAATYASASEEHEWDTEFYTFHVGGERNTDVPQTGDAMFVVQAILAVGAVMSLAGTALFLGRARGEAI